jgi:hypothetical protein
VRDNYKERIRDAHVFGCPAFVLDSRLQDGKKIPKWDNRVRVGSYLGRSPQHAGNVALILNPNTGHVSPQFHVVYDDDFTTVAHLRHEKEPPNWTHLYNTSR